MERNSVTITPRDNKFIVSVVENGKTVTKSFETEAFAQSWASGQTFRVAGKHEDVQNG